MRRLPWRPLVLAAAWSAVATSVRGGQLNFVHEAHLFGHSDVSQVNANFGASVAVSGDTLVVGGSYEDLPGAPDAGAAYVFVRSGATWVLQQRLTASDGAAADRFGSSVSLSSDTLVVGALGDYVTGGTDTGRAYVFVRSGTTWTEEEELTPSDGLPDDHFGGSVSISGDTVVVGAEGHDHPGGSGGSAYVFVRSGTSWTEQQELTASDAPSDGFGNSVGVSGDTALVGAYLDDTQAGSAAGSAYAFVRSGTAWAEQQKLTAADAQPTDFFGWSVSVSGDSAAIGAYHVDTPAGSNVGAAYVFVRAGTAWTQQQKLTASDGTAFDNLGFSVSVAGDTLIAGAEQDSPPAGSDAGSAYVFVRTGATWTEQQKLTTSDGSAGDFFGYAVAVSGDTVAAAAIAADQPTAINAGAAYVFERSGTTWTEQQKLPEDDLSDDRFGLAVAVEGDTAVVGAPYDETLLGRGAAYVHVRIGNGWLELQKLVASDEDQNGNFGSSVSLSGDTLVVGSFFDDGPSGPLAGSAYVFVRSGSVWIEQQKLVASDAASGDWFGFDVAVSGDTVLVSAELDDNAGGGDAGAAYVFVRQGTSWTEQQKLLAPDGATSDIFGHSVALSGDTALVGAYLDDNAAGSGAGAAYVFVRSGAVWSLQEKLLAPDGSPLDAFGVDVAASGDTAVVGAYFDDNAAGTDAGAAYVFTRSGAAWNPQQKLTASGGSVQDLLGNAVSIDGDRLVVGAFGDDNAGGLEAGRAVVFTRSGASWTEQATLLAPDGASDDAFGGSVSISADTVVAGVPNDATPGGPLAGSAHVFRVERPDLSVQKTDGVAAAVPGQPVTYTITVTNLGPGDVAGATVTDAIPGVLSGVIWTCTASAGAACSPNGSGSIDDTVDLSVSGSVTYALTGLLDPSATGTLANTASAALPLGVPDPNPVNNSATDTDAITPQGDLSAAKTDGQATAIPGTLLTYTITVANSGPSDATGTVTDAVPAALLGATWTCTPSSGSSCTVSGSGSIVDAVVLPVGGLVTYLLTGTVDPAATSMLSNAVVVAASGSTFDPNPTNDVAQDTDILLPAGLAIEGELEHGYRREHDLAPLPGPLPDADLFRIYQRRHSSYEVLLDGASGDLGSGSGPLLERLASDASTVVQTSTPAGAGGSRSLCWINALDVPVADQLVRVRSAGCASDCDAADIYWITVRETTGFLPRFNNSGTQTTVLVLQNLGDDAVDVDVRFWSGAGAALGGPSIATLAPRETYVLDTGSVVGSMSGSIAVAHTGRYGQLAGKAVALEPATGFTFDTTLTYRPR